MQWRNEAKTLVQSQPPVYITLILPDVIIIQDKAKQTRISNTEIIMPLKHIKYNKEIFNRNIKNVIKQSRFVF